MKCPQVVFELVFLCDIRRVSDGYILGIKGESEKKILKKSNKNLSIFYVMQRPQLEVFLK